MVWKATGRHCWEGGGSGSGSGSGGYGRGGVESAVRTDGKVVAFHICRFGGDEKAGGEPVRACVSDDGGGISMNAVIEHLKVVLAERAAAEACAMTMSR